MKWWTDAAQFLTNALAVVLIIRLMAHRKARQSVFAVFCVFLAVQLLSGLVFVSFRSLQPQFDYRLAWIGFTVIMWVASLMLVYSLSSAVLASVPNILRISRTILNSVFLIAALLALGTVRSEYWAMGGERYLDPVARVVVSCLVLDRAISTSALLIIVLILCFILWFPVRMPKNVALFSLGFVVYFGCETGVDLLRTYSSPGFLSVETINLANIAASVILILCFVYWLIFLDPNRATEEFTLGHRWSSGEQHKLMGRLEAMNAGLLRNSPRL